MDLNIQPEDIIEDLDKGLGKGPLCLGIYCINCNAQFELSKESVAMAFLTKTTFLEYVRYIQSLPCPKCKNEEF